MDSKIPSPHTNPVPTDGHVGRPPTFLRVQYTNEKSPVVSFPPPDAVNNILAGLKENANVSRIEIYELVSVLTPSKSWMESNWLTPT